MRQSKKSILFVGLGVVALAACGEKPAPSLPEAVPPAAVSAVSTVEQAPQPFSAHAVSAPVAASAVAQPVTRNPSSVSVAPVAKPAEPAAPAADQFLAETIQHARAVTKSENSAARQRGQSAEDEMNMSLAPAGK